MEIRYSGKAVKQFERINKGDKKSAKMILKTVETFAKNPVGNFDIKDLKGRYGNLKRLRTGNYRIIFEDNGKTMSIYEIKHRQEAYHD